MSYNLLTRRVATPLFLALFLLLIQATTLVAAANATLTYYNGTTPSSIPFDRENGTQGSNAYMDQSPTTADLVVTICSENLTTQERLDLGYYSFNRSLFRSVLRYQPRVTDIENNSGVNCSTINPDFSSTHAVYPGYLLARLVGVAAGNNTFVNNSFTPFPILLEGSYEVGLTISGPPKRYHFSVIAAYDGNGTTIATSEPQLVMSLVDAQNETLTQGVRQPHEQLTYAGDLHGGEIVYVNGLASFEARVYNPCEPINESGYYIVNKSAFNENGTCIVINDTDNVLINFATELIDGDGEENGSMQNGTCAILVQNVENVTLENFRSQQFYYGICIRNSTVTVFSNSTVSNRIGAQVANNARAAFIDVLFNNSQAEISIVNNSKVELLRTNITTAYLKGTFKDLSIAAVPHPPPAPDPINLSNGSTEDLVNISQWVALEKTSSGAYGQLNFHYSDPLPNNVVIDNISIYRNNGTYGFPPNGTLLPNGSITNYTKEDVNFSANETPPSQWYNGTWTEVLTYVSPSEQLIIGPNTTNFSIWAPYGFVGQPDETPEPEPEPNPSPKPTAGSGSGGGGGGGGGGGPLPVEVEPEGDQEVATLAKALALKLQVPERVRIQQGAVRSIDFNLSNVGQVVGENLYVQPSVRLGWQRSAYHISRLGPGETTNGTFLIAPWEKALPGEYPVLVSAVLQDENGTNYTVTRELMVVKVLPRGNLSRLKIIEYPPVVEMAPEETLDVAFLAENIGDNDLSGVTASVLSDEDCVQGVMGTHDIAAGETELLLYQFQAGSEGDCDATVQFFSGDELVGFVPITFSVHEPEGKLSKGVKLSILIFILALWTALTFYVVMRRKNS